MESNESNGGIGFFGLLTIVLIVLKLAGVIHWPWLWVLAGIWIPILIAGVVFLAIFFAWLFLTK